MLDTFFIRHMLIKAQLAIEILVALHARNFWFFYITFSFVPTKLTFVISGCIAIWIFTGESFKICNYIVMIVRHENVYFDLIFTTSVNLSRF